MEQGEAYAEFASYAKDDSLGAAKVLGGGIIAPIKDDWSKDNYGEAVGRVGLEVFSAKGLTSLASARRGASAVDDVAAVTPSGAYVRPSGATTAAQRAAVQGKPCVVCGDVAPTPSSSEFLDRLQSMGSNGNAKINEGALARYGGFFRSLSGLLDGSWAFEDCDACYIQLEGFGLPSEAIALGRFLLEDLTHYLADRKSDRRPVLVVLDEFSAISTGADAANLVERAREFGAGVILTTQSYAGLGSGAERVLDAARGGLIVHSLANPEPFTKRAGTVWRQVEAITEPTHQPGVISSILFETRPPETPRKTTREQEFPRIDPNEVRQLPRGDAFVISSGRAQRVRFNEAAIWDENLDLARAEIERRRRGAVATRGATGTVMCRTPLRRPSRSMTPT